MQDIMLDLKDTAATIKKLTPIEAENLRVLQEVGWLCWLQTRQGLKPPCRSGECAACDSINLGGK